MCPATNSDLLFVDFLTQAMGFRLLHRAILMGDRVPIGAIFTAVLIVGSLSLRCLFETLRSAQRYCGSHQRLTSGCPDTTPG